VLNVKKIFLLNWAIFEQIWANWGEIRAKAVRFRQNQNLAFPKHQIFYGYVRECWSGDVPFATLRQIW